MSAPLRPVEPGLPRETARQGIAIFLITYEE